MADHISCHFQPGAAAMLMKPVFFMQPSLVGAEEDIGIPNLLGSFIERRAGAACIAAIGEFGLIAGAAERAVNPDHGCPPGVRKYRFC